MLLAFQECQAAIDGPLGLAGDHPACLAAIGQLDILIQCAEHQTRATESQGGTACSHQETTAVDHGCYLR